MVSSLESRNKGIITLWLGLKALNVHRSPLFVPGLEPSGVNGFAELSVNLETCFSSRCDKVIENGFIAV